MLHINIKVDQLSLSQDLDGDELRGLRVRYTTALTDAVAAEYPSADIEVSVGASGKVTVWSDDWQEPFNPSDILDNVIEIEERTHQAVS